MDMDVGNITNTINIMLICVLSYLTNFKIINKKIECSVKLIFSILAIILFIGISIFITYDFNVIIKAIFIIGYISMLFSLYGVKNCTTVTIISLAINYGISFCAVIINFFINSIVNINNDWLNLIIIDIVDLAIWYKLIKIRRLRNGITFFRENTQNKSMDIFVVDAALLGLSSIILIETGNVELVMEIIPVIIINIISIVFTIKSTMEMYYKQKLLVKELEYTKQELNTAKADNKRLEQENLNFSKTSHSIAHKQKVLEYKINKMLEEKENEEAIKIKKQVTKIAEKIYVNPTTNLNKTEIPKVDDMLEYMQSECTKNNIEFSLQINGNVHYIINNIITENELEILLADHIKDAIIAINHTDNLNKSILVKIGKIDETYGIYIYDSGIEFKEETLQKLGEKPITTHKDEGGTGMGFMNTFETLSKCKGSLIIKEIGNVSKDNFTKAVMIKFDGKGEYKVISYKYDEIKINKKIQNFV